MSMNARKSDAEIRRNALANWENEGGAHSPFSRGHQYGRRIEADRSWTVYHVFTGVPARSGGDAMTGLSRSDATHSMLSLNQRSTGRDKERIRLPDQVRTASRTMGCPS